jgi:hypothetical protein
MTAYRTEQIETPAGVYTVELHPEDNPPNPLTDMDNEGMAFYVVGNREGVETDTLNDADDAGHAVKAWISDEHHISEIERRFAKWKAITGSPWILVTGSGFNSYESYGWMVLVNTGLTYRASDGKDYPALPRPVQTAHATMNDYQTWADGGICGFITKSPSGEVIDSVWGFYDNDEALEGGKTIAECDAADRLDAANLVGAGFVGIV